MRQFVWLEQVTFRWDDDDGRLY